MMGMCSWSFIWVQGCQSTEMSRCIHSLFKLMMASPDGKYPAIVPQALALLQALLAGTVHHHGLALDADQPLLFEDLQHAPDHFPRTTDNATDLLAGNPDLHAIGVGHGIGLLAQVQQGSGYAASHVEKSQIAYLGGGAP